MLAKLLVNNHNSNDFQTCYEYGDAAMTGYRVESFVNLFSRWHSFQLPLKLTFDPLFNFSAKILLFKKAILKQSEGA